MIDDTQAKTPFNDAAVAFMVQNMGFAADQDVKAASKFVFDVLKLAPFYDSQDELTELVGIDDFYLTLNLLENHGVIEHGGGIGGSWLDDKGATVLEFLNSIDWEAPAQITNHSIAQLVQPRHCEGQASEDSHEDEKDSEQLYGACGFCHCGIPEEAFARLGQLLTLASPAQTTAKLEPPLENKGQLQFYQYQLSHLGFIDASSGALTEHGSAILALLRKQQYIA